jgi:hypothetical protein
MMPGSRHARWIMGILMIIVIVGLVLATIPNPT